MPAKKPSAKKQKSKKTQVSAPVFVRPENVELPPKDAEEIELEKLVFGDQEGFETNLKNVGNLLESDAESDASESSSNDSDAAGLSDDELFFIDGASLKNVPDAEGDIEMDTDPSSGSDSAEWEDSDDDELVVDLNSASRVKKLREALGELEVSGHVFVRRLRTQFEKIHPRPKWADKEVESDSEVDSDEDEFSDKNTLYDPKKLLRVMETSGLFRKEKQSRLLTPKKIDIARLKDANFKHVSRAAIQTVQFHPDLPLILTGGYDRTLRLYHVDGEHNNVVSTLFFKNSPIQNAFFATPSGTNKVFLAGRRKFMYKLDLVSGAVEKISNLYGIDKLQKSFETFKISPLSRYIGLIGNNGYVNVLSVASGTFAKNFKVDGVVSDFCWTQDERTLLIVNSAGYVHEFDFESGQIEAKWQDENGVGITKMVLGGKKDRFMAVGSSNGIVNVYDRTKDKKPMGTIQSLVTSVSSLVFNHDGQLLCIASRAKRDALRLVHIPSCSVYLNWPTSGTPLGKVTAVAFSRASEMLAVGNEGGKVRLFRLNDY